MKQLNYEVKELCKRNRDGSYTTQSDRFKILQKMANDLHDLGYRRMAVKSLKPKHVDALMKKYSDEGLSAGTLKTVSHICAGGLKRLQNRMLLRETMPTMALVSENR